MFDTIGRELDPHTNQRRAASTIVVLSAAMGATAALVLIGTMTIAEQLVQPDDAPMIEVVLAEPELGPPPAALAAPPARATRGVATGAASPPIPESTEPTPLDQQVSSEVASDVGTADDVKTGQGVLGDPSGIDGIGTAGGDGPGGGGTGGVLTLHHSDVRAKRISKPPYPADAQGYDQATCHLQITIDETGKPTDIQLLRCPEPFRDGTIKAAQRWRFYAARVGKKRVKAQFEMLVNYRLE